MFRKYSRLGVDHAQCQCSFSGQRTKPTSFRLDAKRSKRVKSGVTVLGSLLSKRTITCGTRAVLLPLTVTRILRQSSVLLDCAFDEHHRHEWRHGRFRATAPGVAQGVWGIYKNWVATSGGFLVQRGCLRAELEFRSCQRSQHLSLRHVLKPPQRFCFFCTLKRNVFGSLDAQRAFGVLS